MMWLIYSKMYNGFILNCRFYNLTIRTTNMASASATCSALIHVLDLNDNAPAFTQPIFRGEIAESAPIASLVIASMANGTTTSDHRFVFFLGMRTLEKGLVK